ncbi:MAG: uroporphyrinogen-III synthase [Devosia sp.]|nr:uroporphyrinogen-III synthase [Devosia sp.]
MLVTRPEPDASETAARLAALDIETRLCPLLTHETLSTGLPDAEGFAAMALTSANALRALAERNALEPYLGLKVFAVGDRTAEHARSCGFVGVESAGGSLADLAELLAHGKPGGPVFYPAGRDQSGDLAKSLAPYGVMVITAQVYAMNAIAALPAEVIGELDAGTMGAALFYSRRAAETFAALAAPRLGRRARRQLGALCLSEAVAEPLIDAHFVRIGLADYPSEEAMMGLALSFARDQNAS